MSGARRVLDRWTSSGASARQVLVPECDNILNRVYIISMLGCLLDLHIYTCYILLISREALTHIATRLAEWIHENRFIHYKYLSVYLCLYTC